MIARVKGIYRSVSEDLVAAAPQVAVALVLFLGAAVVGAFNVDLGARALDAFREYAGDLLEKETAALIVAIFARNATAAAVAIAGGVVLGLVPLAAIFFNGILFGAVLSLFPAEFWKIIPHGAFELPAMFLSWGLGLWIGASLFERSRGWHLKRRTAKSARIFLLVVLPLLAVAALIEGAAARFFFG